MKNIDIQSIIRQDSSNKTNSMINVTNELELRYCTGCSACAKVCPQSAITMQPDREGFLKPHIDKSKCVMCGLCVRKCPQLNPVRQNNPSPVCYAVMADEKTRMKSSSGGMFTIAASWILQQGGVVCGAAFDDDFHVHHVMIHSIDKLPALRGSKYIQSSMDDIYIQIKEKLSEGTPVLFTGVPCQVAALYSVVGRNNKNLYTIDLMCHGVSSYKVLEKYLHDIHHEKPVKELYFKRKEPWGWGSGTSIFFEDGTKYEQYHYFDPFFIAYNSGNSKNAACSFCESNIMPRQGDLTMGDFWGLDILDPTMNDCKGTSAVLVNNEKGEYLFQSIIPKISVYKKEPLAYALAKNSALRDQNTLSQYRDVFFEKLGHVDFDLLVYGCKYNCFYDLLAADIEKNIPHEDREMYLLAKYASEKCGGRQIVTWVRSPKFEKILRQFFKKRVAFGITTRLGAFKDNSIRLFDDISGKSDQYFLVLIQRLNDSFTKTKLLEAGYSEGEDYISKTHAPILIEQYDLSEGPYCDQYGNYIEGSRGIIGKIAFLGYNNRVILGSEIKNPENLFLVLESNTRVEIEYGCRFDKILEIQFSGTGGIGSLHIGEKCTFGSGKIELEADPSVTSVTINENCTFGDELFIEAGQGNKIVIGRDCMIARSVNTVCRKKFSVYEISSGRESLTAGLTRSNIVIGDHTAVDNGCRICMGTEIGSGSIINEYTHTDSRFMNNCLISGNPAAVIRTDVCWSRKPKGTINDCQDQYKNKTGALPVTCAGRKVLVICEGEPIGMVLTKELLKNGHDVTLCGINDGLDLFGTSVRRITSNKVPKEYFDYVYVTAALPPEQQNTLMSSVKCCKYILLSSTLVYPDDCDSPVKEDAFDPIKYQPVKSKEPVQESYRLQEKIAFSCAAKNDIDILSVRAPRIVSEREVYLTAVKASQRAVLPASLYFVNTPVVFVRTLAEFLAHAPESELSGAVNFSDKGIISGSILQKTIYAISKGTIDLTETDTVSDKVSSHVIPDTEKAEKAGFSVKKTDEWLIPMIEYYSQPALPFYEKCKIPLLY